MPIPRSDLSGALAKQGSAFRTYLKLRRKDYDPDAPTSGDEQLINGATADSAAEYAAAQRARANAARLAGTEPLSFIGRFRQKLGR